MKWKVVVFLFFSSWLQAQVYEFNTTQLGQWNGAGEVYSDVWGYSAGGKEYAILGSARYIYFFEVTNPANIRLVDKFGPYTSTPWREFKTYSHYAYAVTDGADAGGLRIFDLQDIVTKDTVIQVRQTTAFFTKCHMPFIDEANGRLYCAGTNTRNDGIIVLDLSTQPDNPTLVINQSLPRGYVHDMYVINNVMYASHIYSGYLSQYNCAGNSCSAELSTFQTGGYNHSSWMNADQTLMINAIETAGHPLWLLPINNGAIGSENVKTFKSVTLRDQYPNLPPGETGSIGHNPYIIGNMAYVSYYTDGVQVYNISDINNVRRVAYFDTDRAYTSYSPVFRGCWGTYPFLPSGNILASDIQSGLWIFKTTPCASSQPPTINITSNSSTYTWGSSFTVNAAVSDPDGTPSKVEFYDGNILLGTDNLNPFSYTVPSANQVAYTITARVFDDCGIITNSTVLNIAISYSCNDGIQSGNETGVDCGGSCGPCLPPCPMVTNLSLGKTATQSSDYSAAYPASKAIDGNLTNFCHTGAEIQPWWQVDLVAAHQVSSIEVTIRTDCCGDRVKKLKVFVSNSPVASYASAGAVYEYINTAGMTNGQVINIPNIDLEGRYVRIWADNTGYGNGYVHLAEVKVMGCCLNRQNPTVSLSSASGSVPQGGSIVIDATASDDGGIIQVEFYNGATLLGADNSAPYSFTINPASASSYNLTAKAIDNCGGSAVSDALIITMTSTCNDGYQNGSETGLDCGGSCTACQTCALPTNLSLGKTSTQSGNFDLANTYPASKAIDGSIATGSFNHTNSQLQPWWQVDLGSNYKVTSIEITHRTGCTGCVGRIKKFRVFVGSTPVAGFSSSGYVYEYNNPTGLGNGEVINIPNLNATGQLVRIWVDHGNTANYLHFAEVKVMGCCLSSQNPTVSISTGASSYVQGSSFTVNASANALGGQVTGVEFYDGASLLATDNAAPFNHTISPAIASSYNLTAKAIDNCGGSGTSNTLNISTTSACNDGYKNGSEIGVDCGGICSPCPQGCITSSNISQGKPASQSSNYNAANQYPASMGVDGSTITSSFNHTGPESQPWWQVDLGGTYHVTSIEITNRTGCPACAGRVKKFRVFVSSSPESGYSSNGYVYEYINAIGLGNGQVINIPNLTINGRYVRVWADNTGSTNNYLHLAEVKVMGCLPSGSLSGTEPKLLPQFPSISSAVRLFPNPTRELLQFLFEHLPESEVTVDIYDLQGRLIHSEKLIQNKMDLTRLESGSYIVHIQWNGNRQIHKMVKI